MRLKKHLVQAALLLPMLGTSISTFATEGTRGGGVAVEINGQIKLRDLVDNTVCRWMTAEGFARTYTPKVAQVIQRIDQAHWALAEGFREEMRNLKVCAVEGELKQVNVEDEDGVTFYVKDQRQAAIRWNDRIWIDMKVLNAMSDTHAAGLVIHEVAHSFIPMDAPMRNNSLRSFVAFLMGPFDKDSMTINLSEDHVTFTPDTDSLPFTKADYMFMKNTKTRLIDRFNLAMKKEWIWYKQFSSMKDSFEQTFAIKIEKTKTWEGQRFYGFVASTTAAYTKMLNVSVANTWRFRSAAGLRELIAEYQLTPSDYFAIGFAGASNVFALALLTGDEQLITQFFPTTPKEVSSVHPLNFLEATKVDDYEIDHEKKNQLRERVFEQLMRNPVFLQRFKNYTYLPTPTSKDATHQRIAQRICMATGGTALQCQIEKFKMRQFIK